MSAESGVPTFRDAQTGLWAQFRPEELATRDAWIRDPETVWRWYQWRRERIRNAQPHAGHFALAHLAVRHPGLQLVTQNVDGLHQLAGSEQLIELHGNIRRNRCFDCERPDPEEHAAAVSPPHCKHCGGLLRPDVVWFGEVIPQAALARATAACETDVFLVVGTSAQVYPAAGLAVLARQAGAFVVEINPAETGLSAAVDCVWRETASNALPQLLEYLI